MHDIKPRLPALENRSPVKTPTHQLTDTTAPQMQSHEAVPAEVHPPIESPPETSTLGNTSERDTKREATMALTPVKTRSGRISKPNRNPNFQY